MLLLIASERARCKHILHIMVLIRFILVILLAISEMLDLRLWRISNPTKIILIFSLCSMQAI